MRGISDVIVFSLLLSLLFSDKAYAGELFNEAVKLYNLQKFEQAACIFDQISRTELRSANASYYLGLCYMQLHRNIEAVAVFSQIVFEFPQSTAAQLSKKALLGLAKKDVAASNESISGGMTTGGSKPSWSNGSSDNLPSRFVVPYTMVGPKYMVDATVNGHALQVCIDSGCDRVIIPIEYIDQIGLSQPSGEYNGHYGGTGAGFWRSQVNIQLGPLSRKKSTNRDFRYQLLAGQAAFR
jgi:tetratricopeptide (TPR) repeat protein